jgi:FkbM family methyltransferase
MAEDGRVLALTRYLEGLRWRWLFVRRYWFLIRTFRHGLSVARAYRRDQVCSRVVLRDGACLLHPPGRAGFLQTFLEIWHERCYVPDRFYRPAPDDVIIDAGANVGLFSVWIGRQSPSCRIVALEPFAENFAFLQKNLQAANLQRATAYQLALGASSGFGHMRAGGTRSLDHQLVSSGEQGEECVPVVSLKELLERIAVDRIAFLKMDIEGAERDVFAHVDPDTLGRIDHLAIEYHEHVSPGVLNLLVEKLEATHDLTVHREPGGKYGMLLGKRRPLISARARTAEPGPPARSVPTPQPAS